MEAEEARNQLDARFKKLRGLTSKLDAEEAKNQLDARFMKLRGLTSKLLKEKMRLLGDMLGVENPGAAKYLDLVQEGSITNEKLLEAVQEASRLFVFARLLKIILSASSEYLILVKYNKPSYCFVYCVCQWSAFV